MDRPDLPRSSSLTLADISHSFPHKHHEHLSQTSTKERNITWYVWDADAAYYSLPL